VAQSTTSEKIIDIRLAIVIILVVAILLITVGVMIGNAFFWDQYETTTKLERDLEVALENVQANPGNADYRIALGWVYFQMGQIDKALSQYKNALKIDPNNMQAKYNLALAHFENHDWEMAKTLMEEYVEKNPLHANGISILGLIYLEMGKYGQAVAALTKSAEISPGNTNIYYNIGIAYEKLGDLDNARKYYQLTLDYNPQFGEANKALKRLGGQ